ncbi:hypothetical protein [Mangrovicoccus sp. HB161399]|uniref:hypothetical protein n=1 Tax=Mangrovicoccus sp. HB161399 TaxID=2720392 RepID=UPI0015522191|nr:hypothetical protein [Mangrovicoccus sp. HB161399]
MGRATITARFFGEDDKPAAQHKAVLQIFLGSRSAWMSLASGASDQTGLLQIVLDNALIEPDKAIPAMRLIEDGSPAPRMLGAPYGMRTLLSGRERVLEVDFGEIEMLGETAYPRQAASAALAREAGAVAGVPRKTGTNQTMVFKTLDRNPALREAVSGRSIPSAGLVINAGPEVAGRVETVTVRDAATGTAAPAIALGTASIEADQFRAIILQKDSLISSRDQQLSARVAELAQANARAESLEAQLGAATERAEQAEGEVARIKAAEEEPAEVTKVIGGIGSKLAEANAALGTGKTPFRLGAVKIDLRGRMTNDGGGIVMGGASKDGSGLTAELFVDRPQAQGTPREDSAVPDCRGLTSAAAQRVLRSVGFRMRSAEQRLAPGQGTPGQALMQHPAAGGAAPLGTEILVVFGMAAAQDN